MNFIDLVPLLTDTWVPGIFPTLTVPQSSFRCISRSKCGGMFLSRRLKNGIAWSVCLHFGPNGCHLPLLRPRYLHDHDWELHRSCTGALCAQGEVWEFRPREWKPGGLGMRLRDSGCGALPTLSLHFLQAKHKIPEEALSQAEAGF